MIETIKSSETKTAAAGQPLNVEKD